jgi:uncharacterized protein YdeI (YjbR/CyaY-like superfamily)
METLNGMEIIAFNDAEQWESWLAAHHELQTGVWMKVAKKGSGIASVTDMEALDVALCYGWITGKRLSYDEAYYLQKYTIRRPRSLWSKVNIAKVEALIAAGRMQAPGLAEINAAKADGRWDAAYESQKNSTVPPDLAAALEQNSRARGTFEGLNRTNRYAVIWRLLTARTAEMRSSRLRSLVAMLERGESFH